MTREDAIKELSVEYFGDSEKIRKAKKMAIKALSLEPCEDCISRQAVIEITAETGALETQARVNALPPVTPKPKTGHWIPVSERLPEEDGEYLLFGKVTDGDENFIFIGEYDACAEEFGIWQEQFDRHTLGCLGSEFYEYESVIAWMPLPKPYTAESEDKE